MVVVLVLVGTGVTESESEACHCERRRVQVSGSAQLEVHVGAELQLEVVLVYSQQLETLIFSQLEALFRLPKLESTMPVTTRKTNAGAHPAAILMAPARKAPRTREELLAEYEQTMEAQAKEAKEKEDKASKLAAVERDMARKEAQARVRRDMASVELNALSALHEEPGDALGELAVSGSVHIEHCCIPFSRSRSCRSQSPICQSCLR